MKAHSAALLKLAQDLDAMFSHENAPLTEAVRGSIRAFMDSVRGAFEAQHQDEEGNVDIWAEDVLVDDPELGMVVVVKKDGEFWAVPFTRSEATGDFTFAPTAEWKQVMQAFVPVGKEPPETVEPAVEPELPEQPAEETGTWVKSGNKKLFVRSRT